MFVDDSLQGIDIVERHALDVLDLRVDVARHGDVDEKERPALALRHELARLPGLDDVVRRPRRRHDDIDIHRLLQRPFERDGLAAELRGQQLRLLDVAVGHVNLAHAVRDEVLRRELRHLARAEDQRV